MIIIVVATVGISSQYLLGADRFDRVSPTVHLLHLLGFDADAPPVLADGVEDFCFDLGFNDGDSFMEIVARIDAVILSEEVLLGHWPTRVLDCVIDHAIEMVVSQVTVGECDAAKFVVVSQLQFSLTFFLFALLDVDELLTEVHVLLVVSSLNSCIIH